MSVFSNIIYVNKTRIFLFTTDKDVKIILKNYFAIKILVLVSIYFKKL